MTTVNPLGTYSVFNADGSPMMWADQPVRIEVTVLGRVLIYAGTWEKHVAECDLPLYPFSTRSIFEGYCRMLVERAMVRHITMLTDRIGIAIQALVLASQEKADLNRLYMAKQIEATEWNSKILKLQEEMLLTRELILAFRDEITRHGATVDIGMVL